MSISKTFLELRRRKKKAFIAFITAGDPDLKTTEELVLAFEKAGVDIVELGVPFSDPMADGPTIQASSFRALQKGTTLAKILDTVKRIRQKSSIPIALMTYYNPVLHFGEEKFIKAAAEAGVNGLIVPDLPPEEAKDLRKYAAAHGVELIFFLAPTTVPDRIPVIARATTGFIYFVSLTGVTGARTALPSTVAKQIAAAKKVTDKPLCVGFGISTPEQVKAMAKTADGVIVGSAIVKCIEQHAGDTHLVKKTTAFVQTLTAVLA